MKSMKWFIITSNAGTKIVPIQKWLFRKYLPDVRPTWIDLGGKHTLNWCKNVANEIESNKPTSSIVMLLDDHLLLDRVVRSISMPNGLERLELGHTYSHHNNTTDTGDFFKRYNNDTLYKVSTQPSIWNTEALIRVLRKVDGDPWMFEKKGTCTAGIVKEPVMTFIAESAISKRRPGKVNCNGMKQEDIDELIEKKLLNKDDIVYTWKI